MRWYREIPLDGSGRAFEGRRLMAGVGFLVLLPMITGVVKMLADLVLVILGILSVVNTI